MNKLALHTCCAPCLIGVYDVVLPYFDHISLIYFNPNIAPDQEYDHRRDACAQFAVSQAFDFMELDPVDDRKKMQDLLELDKDNLYSKSDRCEYCYRMRLGRAARWAAENNYDALATTLSISPWQNIDLINHVGDEVTAGYPDLIFMKYDFREHYKDAQSKARTLGIYRQNYCGCLPSREEAETQRAAARAARKAAQNKDSNQSTQSN